jgi:type IV pilus assembly protein PilW
VKRTLAAQRGFSIVELMVALGISLVLFAGALTIYLTSKGTYVDNERLSRVQETGRIALDVVERDLRNTGVHVCTRQLADRVFSRLDITGGDEMAWDFTLPVLGYDGDATTWEANAGPALNTAFLPDPVPNSDILVVRTPARVGRALELDVGMGENTTDPLIVKPLAGLPPPALGDIMMITNCKATSYFQVTGWDAATLTISHDAGDAGAGAPGNIDNSLEWSYKPDAQRGVFLLPLQLVIYYVREDANGTRSLWRRAGRNAPEPLLDGVEQLQVLFGEDDDLNGVVNAYRNARAVQDWRNVVSVQVALLARSPGDEGTMVDTREYELLDAVAYDPPDERVLRAVFSTTVAVRNRAN